MKLTAVIPVKGRLPLLKHTISRLLERQTHPVDEVICVGSELEHDTVRKAGGIFFEHGNFPLGRKWQYGVDQARERGATDILIMGSSDWISDDWVKRMLRYKGYFGMVGKKDIYFLHLGETDKLCQWKGYSKNGSMPYRHIEPIGTGRIIFNQALEACNWELFNLCWDVSLDWGMFVNVRKYGFKTLCADDPVKALSISTDLWKNKHDWQEEADNEGSIILPVEKLLGDFPDIEELKHDLC